MHSAIQEAKRKIRQNASQGRRTLLLSFYAGHGATKNNETYALFNSNERQGYEEGGNQLNLESYLRHCAAEKGAYVINLLACGRENMPEEESER